MQTVAAYVDLNCVRAGLAVDPKDYRFCGYAEAVSGNEAACAGIRLVVGDAASGWDDAQASYRQVLFGTGAGPREGAATIPEVELQRVMAEGGKLPLATTLRCRIRYFTNGAVLGSIAFVQTQMERCRQVRGCGKRTTPRALPAWTDWGDLAALRGWRQKVIS